MERYQYILYSFLFAMLFWIVESAFHSKVLEDVIFSINPHDQDDFWMRALIIILILGYGYFIQAKIDKERLLKKYTVEVYKAMIKAIDHILNNFLQNMFVFKLDADNSTDFYENIQKLYYEF